jgi:hypothetical protein
MRSIQIKELAQSGLCASGNFCAFRVYSLMDTQISAHHVVLLSTLVVSLSFVHTRLRVRK